MNYGRFFELDFESSRLQEGVAVFNYRWLVDNSDLKGTPRYPIYLTFTSEAIIFNLHYLDFKQEDNHYHNPIIELFLSPNMEISDGLTEALNETYRGEFPVKNNHFLKENIQKSPKWDDYLSEENYSTLDIFEVEHKDNYSASSEKPSHFLRKLILDFLFDFEFTGVFKNLPYYNEVSIKLKENFLFNALMNKTRYYYYRMRMVGRELFSIVDVNEDGIDEVQLQFLFQQYEKAEHDWVSSITDDKAMEAFHESPWFNECHEELEQVYFAERVTNSRKKHNKNRLGVFWKKRYEQPIIPQVSPIPNVLHVNSEKSNSRVSFTDKIGVTRENTFKLTVSNLLNIIHKNQSKECKTKEKDTLHPFGKSVRSHNETFCKVAKWDVGHYQFLGLFRIWCGDRRTLWDTLILFVSLALGLIGLYWFMSRKINSIGWLFIIIFVVGAFLLCLLGAGMRKYRRSTWGMGISSFVMPRLLASIITAWFTLCLSEEVFLHIPVDRFNIPAIIIITFITAFFIGHESYIINPFNNIKDHFKAALWVFVMSYIYAVVSGWLMYDFLGDAFIQSYQEDVQLQGALIMEHTRDNELLKKSCELLNWKHNKAIFILQFSFLVSFIGVFLQMMLQGVSITKSDN